MAISDMKKAIAAAIVFAAVVAANTASADTYTARAIDGQVVDAETGRPVPGAIVVAHWILVASGTGHAGYGGILQTLEAVTDAEGKYHIPGWGPKAAPPSTFLDFKDPELRVFRSGYLPRIASNTPTGAQQGSQVAVRTSEWDGKAIRLSPFKGDNWLDYAFRLDQVWKRDDCIRACPRLVLALDAESKRIAELAPKQQAMPYAVDINDLGEADRAYLRGIKK